MGKRILILVALVWLASPSSQLVGQNGQREVTGWGRFEDPSGVARLEMDLPKVSITSATNTMTAKDTLGKMPRIVRDVSGDFDVQVRVLGTFNDEYQHGVLLAYRNENEFMRMASGIGRYRANELSTGIKKRGVIIGGRHHSPKSTSNWLRIQRIGDSLTSYYSEDGESWRRSASTADIKFKYEQRPGFKGPMQVMLLIHNRSKRPLKVEFGEFVVRQGAEVKPARVIEDPKPAKAEKSATETKRARSVFQKLNQTKE